MRRPHAAWCPWGAACVGLAITGENATPRELKGAHPRRHGSVFRPTKPASAPWDGRGGHAPVWLHVASACGMVPMGGLRSPSCQGENATPQEPIGAHPWRTGGESRPAKFVSVPQDAWGGHAFAWLHAASACGMVPAGGSAALAAMGENATPRELEGAHPWRPGGRSKPTS